jgi:hypothetical protein
MRQLYLKKTLSLALTTFLLLPLPGWSWGDEGHRLIGDIAETALTNTPAVLNHVRQIFGPNVRLRDLATCADRIRDFVRSNGKNPLDPQCKPFIAKFSTPQSLLTRFQHSDKWHFVDIPFDGHPHSLNDVQSFCGPNLCAPERIQHYSDLLHTSTKAADRAEAILFLSHFVGDVHQPLHSAERNNDSGGNLVFVTVFGQTFNLHHVWDDEIILRMRDQNGHPIPTEALRSQHLIANLPAAGPFNPWQWALDAFQQAVTVSYVNHGAVPPGVIPDIRQPPGTTLNDAAYLAKADPATQQQLRLAGVRLAATLASTLNN